MSKKIFSVPLNPKLNAGQFQAFYQWLTKNKDHIADVYFTSRIAPFKQDAMGDLFLLEEDHYSLIETALNIQKTLGIKVSATFNNITVPPTQQNLDKFIINFKPLYDAGIRIATIPHTHWMATGQIKKAFPELFVKNTILRDVRAANEIVALAKYGFDYINLDRDLMRDRDTLLRLKDAKIWIKENLGKDIQYSLLANESCIGGCPMMVEHFEFNNTRDDQQPQYFNNPISRVSCPKWEIEDPAVYLKTANLPPWREDWEEFFDLGIDVFKMHGRENAGRLEDTMDIINRWVAGEKYLHANFEQYLKESNFDGKPIEVYRNKIKNCKFDCWECQFCDRIEEVKSKLDYTSLVKHVVVSIADSGVPTVNTKIPGETSSRVQTVLNSIAKGVGSYLEIGANLGANSAAVLKDNPLTAYFVTNWDKSNISVESFLTNIDPYIDKSITITHNTEPLELDLSLVTDKIQMLFYNGPTTPDDVGSTILYYYSTLATESVLVFNNANDENLVLTVDDALKITNAKVTYKKLILNSNNNLNEWWNGLYVLVINK
jgi:hypothetical protein